MVDKNRQHKTVTVSILTLQAVLMITAFSGVTVKAASGDGAIRGWEGKSQKWQANQNISQCTNTQIKSNIQQLSQKSKKDQLVANYKALVKCNQKAVPEIIKIIEDKRKDTNIRIIAIAALSEINAKTSSSVSALIKAFQDSNVDIRILAADGLGNIGSPAQKAFSLLTKATFEDQNENVRYSAVSAASKIRKKALVLELIQSLKTSTPDEKSARAIEALAIMGYPGGSDKVTLLENIINNSKEDSEIRKSAKLALQYIFENPFRGPLDTDIQSLYRANINVKRSKPSFCNAYTWILSFGSRCRR